MGSPTKRKSEKETSATTSMTRTDWSILRMRKASIWVTSGKRRARHGSALQTQMENACAGYPAQAYGSRHCSVERHVRHMRLVLGMHLDIDAAARCIGKQLVVDVKENALF